jgi:hypothetical protein
MLQYHCLLFSRNKLANIKKPCNDEGADLLPDKHQSNLSSQIQDTPFLLHNLYEFSAYCSKHLQMAFF